jgi:DNA (cytosine-5)-methyltransferase 1
MKELVNDRTTKNQSGLTAIDLFCGGGGFSQGFHQAGFDVVLGIDNWMPACKTHAINGLGETRDVDLLNMDVEKVLTLKEELENKHGHIDVLIGSPPCTEFSYAKNGGKGDIEKGMILVRRNLLFVTLFKPKYWVMENVPRLEEALSKECSGSKEKGWTIPYERLGIPGSQFKELELEGNSLYIPHGEVLIASDYGAHENRKRFIAGNYPIENVDNLRVSRDTDISLGGLLSDLKESYNHPDTNGSVKDPNYPHHSVRKADIRDYDYDTHLHPMYWEEMRHYKRPRCGF